MMTTENGQAEGAAGEGIANADSLKETLAALAGPISAAGSSLTQIGATISGGLPGGGSIGGSVAANPSKPDNGPLVPETFEGFLGPALLAGQSAITSIFGGGNKGEKGSDNSDGKDEEAADKTKELATDAAQEQIKAGAVEFAAIEKDWKARKCDELFHPMFGSDAHK